EVPGGAAEVAQHAAVAGSDLAQVGRPDDAASARLVLHHDARLAVDVARQILREQTPFDVGRATGGRADQEREALALVEGLVRIGGRSCKRGRATQGGNGETSQHPERSLPAFELAKIEADRPNGHAASGALSKRSKKVE